MADGPLYRGQGNNPWKTSQPQSAAKRGQTVPYDVNGAPSPAGGVTSFNTRAGAITLSSSDVTTALTYTPTSVTGLTGAQSVAGFKTGLSLVKADVGLGSVDNTADTAKNVLSATKLATARTLAATGDVTWSGSFDGSANFSVTATIQPGTVTLAKMANVATATVFYRKTAGTGAPEVQTLATLKTDLGLTGTNSGDQTSVTGNAGTATALQTARTIDGQSFDGTANTTIIAPGTHTATSKATPVDADELPIVDSAASNVLKKLTWANLKATLKTYLDTLYIGVAATVGISQGGTGATSKLAAVAALRSACMAKKSADQIGANYTAGPAIAWDAEVYDDDAWHDNVTNNTRLSVPAGVSRVRVGCTVKIVNGTSASTIFLSLLKNGNANFDGAVGASFVAGQTSPQLSFASGPIAVTGGTDYFEVSLFYATDTSIDITAATSNFWIEAA